MNIQPVITSTNGRHFAASAIAVQAILINQQEEILLLNSPTRKQGWQVVSGGLDANETVLNGVLREVSEEVGPHVQVQPLGVAHSQTFHYDAGVQHMVGIYYVLAYKGGDVQPGDDMIGSDFRWWRIEEILTEKPTLHPSTIPWMLQRAIQLYRLWINEPAHPLQPTL